MLPGIGMRLRMAPIALALAASFAAPEAGSHTDTPPDAATAEGGGWFARLIGPAVEFQRQANAEIALHMSALQRGDDLGAFFLGLAIAFAYGSIHAFGPGHGKFVIVSYFLGREARVMRGVVMAAQVAIVHVAAAVVVVWLADIVLKAGFGIGLSEVPGLRAGSFLIIVGIGVYMLYSAVRASLDPGAGTHGRHHRHGHDDHHHDHGGRAEGGLLALAAGMAPCPGAVLIMLYAVANGMIVPGFLLVAAMSLGIGLSICILGVSAILARQTAMRVMERAGGNRGLGALRHGMNYAGAVFVTLVGLASFMALMQAPPG